MTSKTFRMTFAKSSKQTEWREKRELTLESLLFLMQTPQAQEKVTKDGMCFVPGTLTGTSRKAPAVATIDLLVYDIDGGQKFDDIDEKLTAAGIFAIVYSSYSHLTTETLISTNAYTQWATRAGRKTTAPGLDDIVLYLDFMRKGYLKDKNLKFSLEGEARTQHFRQTDDGLMFVLKHDPLEKYRVVIPLEQPIVLADLGLVTRKALDAYKSIYHGVGQALGLDYDHSCEDPSRLYYTQRNTENRSVHYWGDRDNPVFLNYHDYPRAAVKALKEIKTNANGTETRVTMTDFTVTDRNGRPIDLLRWERNNYGFDIQTLFENCLPPELIGAPMPSAGGFHILCPFDGEHTKPNDMGGTYCVNGDGERSWTIYCNHNSCKSQGRTKLNYLGEYVRLGYITAEDLGLEPLPQELSREEQARALNINPDTLPNLNANKDDEDELSSIFEDYMACAKEGDEKLSIDEVYEQSLAALADATDSTEARKAIGRMRSKQCEVDLTDVTEVLAKGNIAGKSLKNVLRYLLALFQIDYDAAISRIREYRLESKTVESSIEELYATKATGIVLLEKQKKIADFYLMDSYTAIRDAYSKYENDLIRQTYGSALAEHFPEMNATWAKLVMGSDVRFLNMPESRRLGKISYLTPSSLATIKKNVNIMVPTTDGRGKTTYTRLFLYNSWMEESTEIKEFSGITCIPNGPKVTADNRFNLWDSDNGNMGFFVPPIKGDCSIALNHIKTIWCNGDEALYNWVITWLAHIFQRPQDKPHTALMLNGGSGSGKSIIVELALSRILGEYYGASAQREDIAGRWSGHLLGKLLWMAEETLFAGDRKGMQVLKDRISRSTVDIEMKGFDKFSAESFTRYIFTSNMTHALHLEHDDRRFCILQTAELKERDLDYFEPMVEWLKGPGASNLLYFFLNWKPEDVGLKWRDLMDAPSTDIKRQQAIMSFDASEQFFLELLRHGRISDTPAAALESENISWPFYLGPNETYDLRPEQMRSCFESYLKYHMGSRAQFDRNKYHSLFKKFFGKDPNDLYKRVRTGSRRIQVMSLPARETIMKYAVKKRFLSPTDLEEAENNPESHKEIDLSDLIL